MRRLGVSRGSGSDLTHGTAARNQLARPRLKQGPYRLKDKPREVGVLRQVADALQSIDVLDPTSELGRFEDKVRREEALVAGKQELAASSLDSQFESLEDLDKETEVEARLAELKATPVAKPAIGS